MILHLNLLLKKKPPTIYFLSTIFFAMLGVVVISIIAGRYGWVTNKPVSHAAVAPTTVESGLQEDRQQLSQVKAMQYFSQQQHNLVQILQMLNEVKNYSACLLEIKKTLNSFDFSGEGQSINALMAFLKKTHFPDNVAEIKVIQLKQVQSIWHFELRANLSHELDQEHEDVPMQFDRNLSSQSRFIQQLAERGLNYKVHILQMVFKQSLLQLRLSGEWQSIIGFLAQLLEPGNPVAIQSFQWNKSNARFHALQLQLSFLNQSPSSLPTRSEVKPFKKPTGLFSQDPFCQASLPMIKL